MSIEQEKVIDIITKDEDSGGVLLVITDHLSWELPNYQHALMLQNKINTYLAFIESGEMLGRYPEYKDKPILIKVVGKYPLSKEAIDLYEKMKTTIQWAGFDLKFEYKLVRDGE